MPPSVPEETIESPHKRRNQKIYSDSKEELLLLCPLGLGFFSLPHSYLLLPAMTVP
jgi:hypothetical protein